MDLLVVLTAAMGPQVTESSDSSARSFEIWFRRFRQWIRPGLRQGRLLWPVRGWPPGTNKPTDCLDWSADQPGLLQCWQLLLCPLEQPSRLILRVETTPDNTRLHWTDSTTKESSTLRLSLDDLSWRVAVIQHLLLFSSRLPSLRQKTEALGSCSQHTTKDTTTLLESTIETKGKAKDEDWSSRRAEYFHFYLLY